MKEMDGKQFEPSNDGNHEPETDKLLLSASEAAKMCGVSGRTWWSYHAGGLIPEPVRIRGRTLWRKKELEAWVAAGCPPRDQWEAQNDAHSVPKKPK